MEVRADAGRLSAVLLMTAIAIGLARCGGGESCEGGGAKLAPLQPNQSSALAEAMRHLDQELVSFREDHMEGVDWNGKAFTEYDLNALEPTDSSMFVEGYTAFAMAFHKQVAAFNAAPGADTYTGVVNGCASCHQRACPGPLDRIAKRALSEK